MSGTSSRTSSSISCFGSFRSEAPNTGTGAPRRRGWPRSACPDRRCPRRRCREPPRGRAPRSPASAASDLKLRIQERELHGVADGLDLPAQTADVLVGDVGNLLEDELLDLLLRQLPI